MSHSKYNYIENTKYIPRFRKTFRGTESLLIVIDLGISRNDSFVGVLKQLTTSGFYNQSSMAMPIGNNELIAKVRMSTRNLFF